VRRLRLRRFGAVRDKKAHDLLVQCEAGLVSVTGTQETPSKAGIAVADIAAGMYAYSGILAALFRRERTGEGAAIVVSLFEALAEWMGFPAYYATYGGKEPPRSGASHSSIAPYGPFACAEGEVDFLGIQNEREWEKFCEAVLERAELAEDARFSSNSDRLANGEALEREIEQTFGHLTAEEVIGKLEGTGIANARLRSVREFLDPPQLKPATAGARSVPLLDPCTPFSRPVCLRTPSRSWPRSPRSDNTPMRY
jgi:itaconate CoA-transferase